MLPLIYILWFCYISKRILYIIQRWFLTFHRSFTGWRYSTLTSLVNFCNIILSRYFLLLFSMEYLWFTYWISFHRVRSGFLFTHSFWYSVKRFILLNVIIVFFVLLLLHLDLLDILANEIQSLMLLYTHNFGWFKLI